MTAQRGRPTAAARAERDTRVAQVISSLLIADGFDAVTFDRVSATAHVAKRTLYAEMGDRAGLVRAVVHRQHAYLDRMAASDGLRDVALAMVAQLLGDEAIGVHRAVVASAARYPALAQEFYEHGPVRAQRMLGDHLAAHGRGADAELVFAALLGEPHRRRLLGIDAAPSPGAVAAHVDRTLRALGLAADLGQESESGGVGV